MFFGLVGVLTLLALRHGAHRQFMEGQSYEDIYAIPPAKWLPWISLSYDDAMASLLWCMALVYQGEDILHRGGLEHVYNYAEAMLTLDPDFRSVYVWIGSAGVYSPQGTTWEDIERTLVFLYKGRKRFPKDGELAWVLGATLAFEAPIFAPKERRESLRLEGLEHLMDAVRFGAAPEWLVLSNSSMLGRLGQAERAIAYLEEMYARISDPMVRAEIQHRIASIRSDVYGQAFVEANENFELERLRTFPYVNPDLFFLIARESPSSWEEGFLDALEEAQGRVDPFSN
ncbi:MAG: hypothetical protein N2515_08180 [Deltaproteobacteria bacterium]|nr:hypothetical protein [Deltaproteobacteria bacterium]